MLAHFITMLSLSQSVGTSVGLVWLLLLVILAYRAWLVPSARRAGLMQIVAVLLGMPLMVVNVVRADRAVSASIEYVLLFAFAVISVAGPILDKLYNSVEDRQPSNVPLARALR